MTELRETEGRSFQAKGAVEVGVPLEFLRLSEGVRGLGTVSKTVSESGRSERNVGEEQSHLSVEIILRGF